MYLLHSLCGAGSSDQAGLPAISLTWPWRAALVKDIDVVYPWFGLNRFISVSAFSRSWWLHEPGGGNNRMACPRGDHDLVGASPATRCLLCPGNAVRRDQRCVRCATAPACALPSAASARATRARWG